MIKYRQGRSSQQDTYALEAKLEKAQDGLLEAYEAIAFLYEENLALREENLNVMMAVAELYEMII